MGLGLHGGGVSVARFFAEQGAKVLVTDLRHKSQLKPSLDKLKGLRIEFVLGKHRESDFSSADLIIQNPGVPSNSPYLKIARSYDVPIENEASIFFSLAPSDVIAITGTKGKSTVTTLIGEIIKSYKSKTVVAGNIRTRAMLDILPGLKKDTPVVLELSSWQLEGLDQHRTSPPVALVTNVLNDHLNRYDSFLDYAKAKSIIFKYQTKNNVVVFNYDNLTTRKFGQQAKSRVVWFSTKPFPRQNLDGAYVSKKDIYYHSKGADKKIMSVKDIQLAGNHNLQNVLAAIVLSKAINIPEKNIVRTVKRFQGIPNRLELIRTINKVKYINDTTATAPVATQAALEAIGDKKHLILIAGGQDKDLDYKSLGRDIDSRVKALVLLPGNASDKIRKSIRKVKLIAVSDMKEAIDWANSVAKPKDIVLLSPAAASFNLYENEFARGEHFNKIVKRL